MEPLLPQYQNPTCPPCPAPKDHHLLPVTTLPSPLLTRQHLNAPPALPPPQLHTPPNLSPTLLRIGFATSNTPLVYILWSMEATGLTRNMSEVFNLHAHMRHAGHMRTCSGVHKQAGAKGPPCGGSVLFTGGLCGGRCIPAAAPRTATGACDCERSVSKQLHTSFNLGGTLLLPGPFYHSAHLENSY